MGNVIPLQQPRVFRAGPVLRRYLGVMLLAACAGVMALANLRHQAATAAVPPSAFTAVRAVDGDTLSAQQDGKPQRIRLAGIDAPELRQTCRDANGRDWSCGAAARLRLAALVAQGPVACTPQGEDRYGRLIATCSAGTVTDLGAELVRGGYAVNYSRYTSDYMSAERDARAARNDAPRYKSMVAAAEARLAAAKTTAPEMVAGG